jgi:L-asparaginase
MPRVLLLATGDVIADQGGVRDPGLAAGATLLDDLPRGSVTADVVVEDVLAEPSWDTSVSTMLALARRARSALTQDGFAGLVVTHGLDTIEETAFLTDLVLGKAAGHDPVVFTGAARCSARSTSSPAGTSRWSWPRGRAPAPPRSRT